MVYGILADLIVIVHFGFVLFVVLGAVMVLKWSRLLWFHIPAVLWGALVEYCNILCPLTPLENYLRALSGSATYSQGFIEQYIMPVMYPAFLTRNTQWILGSAVLGINVLIYGFIVFRKVGRPGDKGKL